MVDVDVDETAVAMEVERIAIEMLGNALVRRRANSPRVALMYRAQRGEPAKRTLTGTTSKIEILGRGQQLVMDGMHESGVPYAWQYSPTANHRDTLRPVSDEAITAFLTRSAGLIGADASKIKSAAPAAKTSPSTGVVSQPQAVSERDKAFAAKALRENSQELRDTSSGRNTKLNAIAYRMGRFVGAGHVGATEVECALMQAATENGYVSKRGYNMAHRTLKSGMNSGINQPVESTPDLPPVDISAIVNGKGASMNIPSGNRQVILTRGTDIQHKTVRWLWRDWLARGKVTILAGNPGTGKSTITLSIAATVTTGGEWPDGTRCKRAGNVLIWSSEDDPEDTIAPRLWAAGADASRYLTIDGTTDGNQKKPFDPSRDMELLKQCIRESGGIDLLIIDPVIVMTRGKNSDAANDVREALQPLVDLAREFDCVVIGITHRRKTNNGKRDINPMDGVLGSQAYVAVARVVIGTVRDRSGQCTMFRMKSNIGKDGDGFNYDIRAVPIPNCEDDETTRIVWGEPVQGTATQIVQDAEIGADEDDKHGNKMNAAIHLMKSELANGPRSQSEIEALCRSQEISRSTMMRAKAELKIKSVKATGTMLGGWEWHLPITPDFSALLSSVGRQS